MYTVYVDVDYTLLRPGREGAVRPSAAPFLRALRERGIRVVALGNGPGDEQRAALRDVALLPLLDAVCGRDDTVVPPDGPWILVDDEDPVHDGTRRKIERLGVVAGADVWLRHYLQCEPLLDRDREPLVSLVPLAVRMLDQQAGAPPPGREPIPTHWFVLAVVRRDGRYLVVHELHHDGWYLAAGRMDPGETVVRAARREVLEESGVHVEVTGLVRVEHRPTERSARVRVFVLAEALGAAHPRTTPNAHTREARWVTPDELRRLPLRSPEVLEVIEAVEAGCPVVPWSIWDASGVFG